MDFLNITEEVGLIFLSYGFVVDLHRAGRDHYAPDFFIKKVPVFKWYQLLKRLQWRWALREAKKILPTGVHILHKVTIQIV